MNLNNDFLLPELGDLGLDEIWFQQDGATAHTARAEILQASFPGHLISSFGDLDWSERSPNVTVL